MSLIWRQDSGFDRLVDDMFRFAHSVDRSLAAPTHDQERPKRAALNLDISETDAGYTVTADLPGIPKENLKVQMLEGNKLAIEGKRDQEKTQEGEKFLRRERSTLQYYREVVLPRSADTGAIDGEFKDGVLTISVPKRPEGDNARMIDIR